MQFYLNGQPLDITLEEEKTVGDVLKSFEQTAMENRLATVGIVVDGKKVDADNFDENASVPLKEDMKIELSVVSEAEVVEGFKKAAEDIDDTVELLLQVPSLLQSGTDSKVRASITRLADVVDNFCHVTALATLFPEKFSALKIEGKTLSNFFDDFLPIFKELGDALENGDSVLLGDLAEYEISPRLKSLAAAVEEW